MRICAYCECDISIEFSCSDSSKIPRSLFAATESGMKTAQKKAKKNYGMTTEMASKTASSQLL